MQCNKAECLRTGILSSDTDEIDTIIGYVLQRYGELMPTSEMVCLFLPRNDPEERSRIFTQSAQFLESHQTYA